MPTTAARSASAARRPSRKSPARADKLDIPAASERAQFTIPQSQFYGTTLHDNPFNLSINELKFASLLVADPQSSVARAAELAGISQPTAHKWLQRDHVRSDIARRIAARAEQHRQRYEITTDRIAREYAAIAFSHAVDYDTIMSHGDLSKLSYEQRAAIKTLNLTRDDAGNLVVMKLELHDKMRALDQLAKHLGMLSDTVNNITIDNRSVNVTATRELVDTITSKLRQLEQGRPDEPESAPDIDDADYEDVPEGFEPVEGDR